MYCHYSERDKKRIIHNLKVTVENYESDHPVKPKISWRQRMSDIWARCCYEISKIKLEAIEKYGFEEAYSRIRNGSKTIEFVQADVRMKVSAKASGGRTLKVTELSEEELENARQFANDYVDKYVEEFRTAVL